ncbi:hypothetical protein [Pseudarthrobacter sp. BIM B-2242]|uniref:hypothetical protein n=1 Tax=Pseudarthrobacter sp. BIM B-2242 TaxID=2772401 RepID=UPI00168A411E|nr:hypothetical protein [Pseudarthrobacter sp. BIM B-2242]QOD06030.1 hypothetical protein IDT60_20920 [Pseudarthrobacter sp. BIM B-2242]
MTALAELILVELQRHEAEPSFNLRCTCGHIGTTVSRRGDFERHVAQEMAAVLDAAGVATAAEVLEKAAEAAEDPTPKDMDDFHIDQADVGPWLRARAAAERSKVSGGH